MPDVALDLRPRSGPIVIMVEYIIREDDLPAFLAGMGERRRIRRRNGARQWELMRDMQNPEEWIESYHLPTWIDYVRYNQRTTKAYIAVGDAILGLHRGDGPPRVHRMIVRPTRWEDSEGQLKAPMDLH